MSFKSKPTTVLDCSSPRIMSSNPTQFLCRPAALSCVGTHMQWASHPNHGRLLTERPKVFNIKELILNQSVLKVVIRKNKVTFFQ